MHYEHQLLVVFLSENLVFCLVLLYNNLLRVVEVFHEVLNNYHFSSCPVRINQANFPHHFVKTIEACQANTVAVSGQSKNSKVNVDYKEANPRNKTSDVVFNARIPADQRLVITVKSLVEVGCQVFGTVDALLKTFLHRICVEVNGETRS